MRYKCAKNLTLYAVVQSLVTVQYNYLKIIINFNVKSALLDSNQLIIYYYY